MRFIKAALDSENDICVESGEDPHFKRLNVISPPRNVKKSRPYSSPMPKQSRKTSSSAVSRAENEPEGRRRVKRSMLFNGNDDMTRVADLGDPLKGTLNSDDFLASSTTINDNDFLSSEEESSFSKLRNSLDKACSAEA